MSEVRNATIVEKAAIGGVACAITSGFLNPIDVTKIKLQNETKANPGGGAPKYRGFLQGMGLIVREEGFGGLLRGMEPAVLREIFYGSIRLGGYEPIRNFLAGGGNHDAADIGLGVKYGSALLSGAIGAIIANPFDLIKTRYQAVINPSKGTTGLPYKNTFEAIPYIIKNEGGLKALYKGTTVTAVRASIVTSSQIGTYDSVKNNLLKGYFKFEEGVQLHIISAMIAGISVTLASNPVDVIKSRYMSDAASTGTRRYDSIHDCVRKTYTIDGARGFYKGVTAAYCRFGPHSFISLLLIERIRKAFGFQGM